MSQTLGHPQLFYFDTDELDLGSDGIHNTESDLTLTGTASMLTVKVLLYCTRNDPHTPTTRWPL